MGPGAKPSNEISMYHNEHMNTSIFHLDINLRKLGKLWRVSAYSGDLFICLSI